MPRVRHQRRVGSHTIVVLNVFIIFICESNRRKTQLYRPKKICMWAEKHVHIFKRIKYLKILSVCLVYGSCRCCWNAPVCVVVVVDILFRFLFCSSRLNVVVFCRRWILFFSSSSLSHPLFCRSALAFFSTRFWSAHCSFFSISKIYYPHFEYDSIWLLR